MCSLRSIGDLEPKRCRKKATNTRNECFVDLVIGRQRRIIDIGGKSGVEKEHGKDAPSPTLPKLKSFSK